MPDVSKTASLFRLLSQAGVSSWKHGLGVPDGHRGPKSANTWLKRYLLLARWLLRVSRNYPERRVALDALRLARTGHPLRQKKKCVILGSGVISQRNLDLIREISKDSSTAFIAMNHFDKHPLFGSVDISFWLMLDRAAQQGNDKVTTKQTWKEIQQLPNCAVVVPWQDFKSTNLPNKLGFENHSLAGLSWNVSPLWPRGYEGKSCLKAICLADYLGFGEIVVAGCSNDYYKRASVTNGLVDANEVKEFAPMSAEDYFQNIANEFAWQRMVLSKIKSKVTFLS